MDLNKYADAARKTAIYPLKYSIIYPALGLAGEAGEVCEKIKKEIRDCNGLFLFSKRLAIAKELGDVLWYVANLAKDINWTLDNIAKLNLEKLQSRAERAKLNGSGDNR